MSAPTVLPREVIEAFMVWASDMDDSHDLICPMPGCTWQRPIGPHHAPPLAENLGSLIHAAAEHLRDKHVPTIEGEAS
jgi:hypothetical protein